MIDLTTVTIPEIAVTVFLTLFAFNGVKLIIKDFKK